MFIIMVFDPPSRGQWIHYRCRLSGLHINIRDGSRRHELLWLIRLACTLLINHIIFLKGEFYY